MAVDTGYPAQTNVLFPLGITDAADRNVEAAFYPARLVITGTTDRDAKPANCLKVPFGWAPYEQVNMIDRPATIATAFATSATVPIVNCPGKDVFIPSGIPIGFKVEQGDILIPWGTAGQVAPAVEIGGKLAVKVPFIQKTSSYDTGIDFPGSILLPDTIIDVVTNVAGSSIDVGFINAVESGDEDGLLDGESCVAAGLQEHVRSDATAGNITVGAYLRTVIAEANGASATNVAMPKKYLTDGTIKSLCYKTSSHAVTGWIYVFVESPGLVKVAKAKYAVDATSAAKDILVTSAI
jgi:hypothetical protein